jgi:hypothetical protein
MTTNQLHSSLCSIELRLLASLGQQICCLLHVSFGDAMFCITVLSYCNYRSSYLITLGRSTWFCSSTLWTSRSSAQLVR